MSTILNQLKACEALPPALTAIAVLQQEEPVCVAVSRVFGSQTAELPLVATATGARRKGHARVLLAAFEGVLKEVRRLTYLS